MQSLSLSSPFKSCRFNSTVIARVLCAALLSTAGAAHAFDPRIETAGFTLGATDLDPFVDVWLTSETATSATFQLWGIESGLQTATDSSYQPHTSDYRPWQNHYGIVVKDGYRITGITVTGAFTGDLNPAQWTMPGDAGNQLSFGFNAGDGVYDWAGTTNVDGQRTFTLSSGPISRQGEFSLSFDGGSESWAQSVWYLDELSGEQYWLGSQATAGIGALTLTVNVSAVPEPGTWAMLALGLAALGGAGRLRRRHGGAA